MRRRRRIPGPAFWLTVVVFGVLVGLVVLGTAVPVGKGQPQLVTIVRGDSVSDVAMLLRERGLIRSAEMFSIAAYATGKWRRIQAGRHELDGGMSAMEILDALCRGSRRAWRWLTIPEGFDIRQIAEQVEKQGLGKADGFVRAATASHASVGFPLPTGSLEGYLFPDTYRVDSGEDESDIVAQMLRRFDQVVWRELFGGKPSYKGRSLHDTIILASLVEWEAKHDKERAVIAGVLVNRLNRGQKLECDATVQYALGEGRKSRLMNGDLAIESEYNTYLHEGLPPGPICSPGEESIRAAMNPARVPYLYYVARADGSHVFSTTYSAHMAAVNSIRRSRASQEHDP